MLLLQQDTITLLFFKCVITAEEIKIILDNNGYLYFTINDIKLMLEGKNNTTFIRRIC